MDVKKLKISREILKVSQVPTRKSASYGWSEEGRPADKWKILMPVIPKVCYADLVGSTTSSLRIRVYVSVMAILKFDYYFKKYFVKNNRGTSLIGDVIIWFNL
jgi:hypothetical protein